MSAHRPASEVSPNDVASAGLRGAPQTAAPAGAKQGDRRLATSGHPHTVSGALRTFIERHFLLLIALYVGGKVLLRAWLSPALGWDESEAALQAQSLLLGYGTQPPLYMWVQYLTFRLLGENVLAVACVKGAFILALYYGAYAVGRTLTHRHEVAVWGSLALLALPLVGYEVHRDLSHTVAGTTFAVFTFLFALRIVTAADARLADYAGLGIAVGLGLLSKYNLAVLVLAMALAALTLPPARARLLDPRILLAATVAALLVLPHGLWMLTHADLAVAGNFEKLDATPTWSIGSVLGSLMELALALANFGLLAVLVILGWLWPGRAGATGQHAPDLARRFLARDFLVTGAVLVGLVVFTASATFKARWLAPLLVLLPVLMVAHCWNDRVNAQRRNGLALTLLMLAFVQTALIAAPVLWPAVKGKPGRLNIPVVAMAETLQDMGFVQGTVLTEMHSLGGSLRLINGELSVIVPRIMKVGGNALVREGDDLLVLWRPRDGAPIPPALEAAAAEIGFRDCPQAQDGTLTAPYRRWQGEPYWIYYRRYPAVCQQDIVSAP